MGILHHQGLKKNHHGIFVNIELDQIIKEVSALENSSTLISDLLAFKNHLIIQPINLEQQFQKRVSDALKEDPIKRKNRLELYDVKPKRILVTSYAFDRNPDVVAEALYRAQGNCERCLKSAPFNRKTDNTPYLEVHHLIPLSEGGNDELKNVLAVCPNCHRDLHYGAFN